MCRLLLLRCQVTALKMQSNLICLNILLLPLIMPAPWHVQEWQPCCASSRACTGQSEVLHHPYRSIKNKALMYLAMLKDEAVTADVLKRFRGATNMTDKIAMLATLADTPGGDAQSLLST